MLLKALTYWDLLFSFPLCVSTWCYPNLALTREDQGN